MATIGFAGLGHMGTPMVGRLAAAGHRLLVFDVAPAARARHEGIDGIAVVSQVAEIAGGADIVILMLPDSAVVAQVLLADGLLEHVASSAVVVDMSSSVPARTRELARAAAERGITLIDAPVSGGVAGARTGSLTIMAGGPADVLDRLRPVLQVLGSHVVHAGDFVGAGHAIKALNNMMSAAHLLASSEALLAGRRFGLDPDVMLSIVNSSSGRSGSTQVKWPKFILPDAYDSGFGLRLMLKDMRIALQLEQESGVPAPLGQAAVAAWAAAAEDLPPAADHTEIARWLAARIDQGGESERPLRANLRWPAGRGPWPASGWFVPERARDPHRPSGPAPGACFPRQKRAAVLRRLNSRVWALLHSATIAATRRPMRASGPGTPCVTLWFIVPPWFPAISSPVTIESRREAVCGASEEIPILPAERGLSQS